MAEYEHKKETVKWECPFERVRDYPGCYEDCPNTDDCKMGEKKAMRHHELIGTKYEHNPYVGTHPGTPNTIGLPLSGERWQEGYDFAVIATAKAIEGELLAVLNTSICDGGNWRRKNTINRDEIKAILARYQVDNKKEKKEVSHD